MVNQMDKDTKHIKDQSIGTEEYLVYRKQKEKGTVNQLDVRNQMTTILVVRKLKTRHG